MDLQAFINASSEIDAITRGNYHLTFGDLIDALRKAPQDAKFDSRIKGISAYRGYYTDICLNTDSEGYSVSDEEYHYDGYDAESYKKYREEHVISGEFPTTASELVEVLESLLNKGFGGYKGGWYKITRDKPLWIAEDYGDSSELAVIGITDDLALLTKTIEP